MVQWTSLICSFSPVEWFLTYICCKSSIFLLILLTFDLLETKQSKFCWNAVGLLHKSKSKLTFPYMRIFPTRDRSIKSSTWFELSGNVFFFKARGARVDVLLWVILGNLFSLLFLLLQVSVYTQQTERYWLISLLEKALAKKTTTKNKTKKKRGWRGRWLSRQAAGCACGRPCLTWKKNLLPESKIFITMA